jgi:hypothetical protein
VTVFDLVQSGYQAWRLPLLGLGFMLIAPAFLVVPEGLMNWGARRLGRKRCCILFVVIGTLESSVSFAATYFPFHQHAEALRSGRYEVVDGTISDYQPGRAERPAEDQSFSVGGLRFVISRTPLAGFGGFDPSSTPSIRSPEGTSVRISYLPGNPPTILRIELKR